MDENRNFENEIGTVNKRIDEVKWSINLFAGAVSLIMLAVSIFLGMRLTSEMDSIRQYESKLDNKAGKLEADLKQQISEILGKTKKQAQLIVRTPDGKSLAGGELKATIEQFPDNSCRLVTHLILENVGQTKTDYPFVKLCSSELRLYYASTDESDFRYEDYIKPEDSNIMSLPARMCVSRPMVCKLEKIPPVGHRCSSLLKLAYGDDQETRVPFTIIVEEVKMIEKLEKAPKLVIQTVDRKPLEGNELRAAIEKDKSGSSRLALNTIFRNVGGVKTDYPFVKLYVSGLQLRNNSTDEGEFEYEDYITPESAGIKTIPAGISLHRKLRFPIDLSSAPPLKEKEYPALLELAYGEGVKTRIRFKIVLDQGPDARSE
jgi:hypothetical protein